MDEMNKGQEKSKGKGECEEKEKPPVAGQSKGFISRHARIATVLAVVCGATSGPLSAMIDAPSLAIGFWRLTVAVPIFLLLTLGRAEKRQALAAVSKKDLAWCLLSGLFLFGHYFSWFTAAKTTSIASASVLASFHPLVVLAVSLLLFKRKVSLRSTAAILVALAGGAVIVGFDYRMLAGENLPGNLFALSAGICMGLYFCVGDWVRRRVDGEVYVLLVFTACWALFAGAVAVTGTPLLGYRVSDYLYIGLMAILCQIGTHAVLNLCIGHVSSLYVSAWEACDPVFSTLLALLLLSQIPSGHEVVGCILVVAALLYYNWQESKEAA